MTNSITLAQLRSAACADRIIIRSQQGRTLHIDVEMKEKIFQLSDSSGRPLELQNMSQVRSCLHGIATDNTEFVHSRADYELSTCTAEMMMPTSTVHTEAGH